MAVTLLAACGSDSSDKSTKEEPKGAYPVTVRGANGEVTVWEQPRHIVSLSPTATETLYAIDAGRQVIAVDDQSTYPTNAPKTNLSGLTPNAEAIAKQKPDLVLLPMDAGGIVEALKKLNVPVLVQSAATNLDEVYGQIRDLGAVTGHVDSANAVLNEMRTMIESAISHTERPAVPLRFYHELDSSLYSITSTTFLGQIYARFGLQNIADAADKTGTGYPQLSPEYVVTSNPNLVFLADTKCCGQNADTVASRAGWADLAAVKNGGVIPLDDDIASRWGPRTGLLVNAIADAIADVVRAQSVPLQPAA